MRRGPALLVLLVKCAVDADCLRGQTCQGGVCALP
jgi:hypothetical protein